MVSFSFMLEGFREFSEIVFCVCVSVGGGEVYVYMCDLYITPPCTITLYFFLSNWTFSKPGFLRQEKKLQEIDIGISWVFDFLKADITQLLQGYLFPEIMYKALFLCMVVNQ